MPQCQTEIVWFAYKRTLKEIGVLVSEKGNKEIMQSIN